MTGWKVAPLDKKGEAIIYRRGKWIIIFDMDEGATGRNIQIFKLNRRRQLMWDMFSNFWFTSCPTFFTSDSKAIMDKKERKGMGERDLRYQNIFHGNMINGFIMEKWSTSGVIMAYLLRPSDYMQRIIR